MDLYLNRDNHIYSQTETLKNIFYENLKIEQQEKIQKEKELRK